MTLDQKEIYINLIISLEKMKDMNQLKKIEVESEVPVDTRKKMQIQCKYKYKLNMFKYQLNCRFQSKPPTAKYPLSCGIWMGFREFLLNVKVTLWDKSEIQTYMRVTQIQKDGYIYDRWKASGWDLGSFLLLKVKVTLWDESESEI